MSAVKGIGRKLHLAGLALGGVLLLPDTASARGTGAPRAFISTQGHGEVRVRPDSVRVSLGVEAEADALEKAQAEVSTRMQAVLQDLNALNIPGLTLQTQTIQLYPVRESPRPGEVPRIVGYRAVNTISATIAGAPVDELGTLASRIIDTAVRAGANLAGGVSFFVRDVRAAQDRALEAAVRDAERSARAMARAAGGTLGKLHSLEGSPSFQSEMMARGFTAELAVATPVAAGETVITSNVSARFTFRK